MNYDVCLIGAKDTTVSLGERLIESGCGIDLIITVDASAVDTSKISGYSPISDFARGCGAALFETAEYSLRDDRSREFFESNTFGIGICMGWQRLIPKEVLDRFGDGIFGFHGSCGYLPYGRGRSPLNWSIINGDTRFILNMFRYDEKADSPNVYKNRMFEITPYDTIRTLQYKNLLVSFELARELLRDHREGSIAINTGFKDFDSLYPKRSPEDGRISFTMKTRDIYNLIRGTTRPFPGAFCFRSEDGARVGVWEAAPFDGILDFSGYRPGEVIDVFDAMPVVRTVDGSLIVKQYESEAVLVKGDILC